MKTNKKDYFDFSEDKVLSDRYEVVEKLGEGWEGEVYLIKEIDTEIERAAKFFYPERNPKNKTVYHYAKKLHKLRGCNSLIKYISKERFRYKGKDVTYLISDFVEGETLGIYIKNQYPKGMNYYQALHLFYALIMAVEEIHLKKEWHGDVHVDNIIIQRAGLKYDLKLIDIFKFGPGEKGSIQEDIVGLCNVLFELLGGRKKYKGQPEIIKSLCCGLKKTIIRKKFKNATQMRNFLENTTWESINR